MTRVNILTTIFIAILLLVTPTVADAASVVSQAMINSFPDSVSYGNPKSIIKPKISHKPFLKPFPHVKPSKKPSPSPSLTPFPSPSDTSLIQAGLQITPVPVDVTINLNETKKAFDLKSITAGGFQMYGYPTDYGPGINWDVSSGGMTPGSSTEIGIQVNSNTPPGIYTGTGKIINLTTSEEMSFPVKVTVLSPLGFPYVKITYPNGGEVFTVGDKVNIEWEGDKLNSTCQLGYTIGPGTLDWINFSFPGTERSYEWIAKEWNNDLQPDNMKITLDCYTDQGLVSDVSDGFFTVKPLTPQSTPQSSIIPLVSPQPLSYPGSFFGGVTISGFSSVVNQTQN